MSSMNQKEILIIDDEPEIRLLAKKILEGDGARVIEAASADEGLSMGSKSVPHLIILDLSMPEKTGYDFLKARRDLPFKDVPVIILSGRKDKASVLQAIALGSTDYLLKPFRGPQLLQKARKALRLSSFLVKKLPDNQTLQAIFTINAQISKVSEGGCEVEAPVRLGVNDSVVLNSELLERIGVQDLIMRVSPNPGKFEGSGLYVNEVGFIGMNEERAKAVRSALKDLK